MGNLLEQWFLCNFLNLVSGRTLDFFIKNPESGPDPTIDKRPWIWKSF